MNIEDKRRMLATYHRLDPLVLPAVYEAVPSGTLAQFLAGEVRIGIRHDMDSDIENSVKMAEWEAERGYRSTYFVLHTDWYWREDGAVTEMAVAALARIAELGHEIGLHNNAVAASLSEKGVTAHEVLERELGALRTLNHNIVGVASHGDSLCHKIGYSNEEVFSEFCTPPHREILHPRPLRDYGLTYEAYHLGYDEYLSDNGGGFKSTTPEDFVAAVKGGRTGVVLVHPLHWNVP